MADSYSGELARVQTPAVLILNACGTMIGTGVYTMTGQMAGSTGYATVIAFLVGLVPTLFVGLVYAALATRFPRASSLSSWLMEAFGNRFLSLLGGSSSVCLYMFAGTSTTLGAVLTFFKWFDLDASPFAVTLACMALLLLCFFLTLSGLQDTSRILAFCTYMEIAGLAVIIVAVLFMPSAREKFLTNDWLVLPSQTEGGWLSSVVAGGVFVVFSFGGFETIASQAEEAKDPERVLPWVFASSLFLVAVLNVLIVVATLCVLEPHLLASSPDPLTDVMEHVVPWLPRWVFTYILFASAFNSVLGIQIHISRSLYGMACEKHLPAPLAWTRAIAPIFGKGNAEPQPYVALAVTVICQGALLLFGLQDLGKNCATLLVISFLLAHAAYIGVLMKETSNNDRVFTVPIWVPICGVVSTAFVLYHALQQWGWHFLAGWVAFTTAVYFSCNVGTRQHND